MAIAKNFLSEDELAALNNQVEQYLVFATGQAMRRIPMKMANRISKLDSFLTINDRDILAHAGKISHDTARLKAEAEYDTFRVAQAALPQPVDQHFQDAIDELKKIEGEVKKTPKRPKRRKEKDE
ncbi:MAG: RhuM family protein [Planctomycetaceae bacterium]